jgi:hypothetical protein
MAAELDRDRFDRLHRQAARLLALRTDPRAWLEANLRLRTKGRQVIPFALNAVQADYYARRSSRDIILKPRQLGFTTLVCGLFFADAVLQPNTFCAMVAHDADSAQRIFGIVRLFWERLEEGERRAIGEPRYENRKEFYWPRLNSRFCVGTAGSFTFGRGQTINNLHCSEFAFWPRPEEALVALTEAVPLEGRIVIESTANGMGNFLHDLWSEAKAGESNYTPHFYPWWGDPEYRLPYVDLGELTEEEARLQQTYGLDVAQLAWRRQKQRDLRDAFPQEYAEDDVTCFLASGRCCFDARALLAAQQRIAGEPEPELITQLPDKEGNPVTISPARLLVWRHPDPDPKHKYVIGADVGEGLAHGDASVATVIDRKTGEQVAELHGRIPPDRFARQADALGRYYRNARLGVERNNHGHSALSTLFRTCQYPTLYHHARYDQAGRRGYILGWPTDQSTKPIMVDGFAEAIAGGHLVIHSSGLVDECFTFITTDSGSQEAQSGKHDDRVIAAAIAWQMRQQPEFTLQIARAW